MAATALLAVIFTISSSGEFYRVLAENAVMTEDEAIAQGVQIERIDETVETDDLAESDMMLFRPVDCGLQAQETYEYPFIGLTVRLTQSMLDKIDSRDIYLSVQEDYEDETTILYAMMRFFAPDQEQKTQEGFSVDILEWEDSLEKIGVLGVYRREQVENLDALTGCDVHNKIGASADDEYEYYLSVNSQGDAALIKELEAADVTISEMRPLKSEYFYGAFSVGRDEDVTNVGVFNMEDVFGKAYTQEIFGEYDLTLVNVFATWCSPCVEEMPELEKLRQTFEDRGIKLGVIAMVMDTKLENGDADEETLQKARALYERSGAQFPFLIPDEGGMNGRLIGLESYPESFFVDSEGNIVSEPYLGARSLEEWTQIAEQELADLKAAE